MTQGRPKWQDCLFCHPLFINSCRLVIIAYCADTHYCRRQAIIVATCFIIIWTVNKREERNEKKKYQFITPILLWKRNTCILFISVYHYSSIHAFLVINMNVLILISTCCTNLTIKVAQWVSCMSHNEKMCTGLIKPGFNANFSFDVKIYANFSVDGSVGRKRFVRQKRQNILDILKCNDLWLQCSYK